MKKISTVILLLAFLASVPSLAQQRLHRRCGTSMMMERALKNGDTRAISSSDNYVPHSGTLTIPVILVNFSDKQFAVNNPKEAFNQFFNADSIADLGNGNRYNYGSVRKYFRDMSGGAFNLSFDVHGPVTLDNPETYYGGKNDDDTRDENPRQLVIDAIAKLQSSSDRITNISSMSSDGSTIDCVYIVYAGLGQNDGGDSTTVWANTWTPYSSTSILGRQVRWYSMAGELSPFKLDNTGTPVGGTTGVTPMITGVGVTCHELSHALGLPDIYPTNTSAQVDNQEMEYWDLMDGGEYSGNGYCPTAYTAFEKNEMEWNVDIQELSENRTVSMTTSTEQGGTAYKIVNPNRNNEYFLLELIQRRGWNSAQNGNGLLVYHVNRPSGGLTSGTYFNNTPGYPGMAVVPADGLCASSYEHQDRDYPYYDQLHGDLFPGTGNLSPDTLNVTELSDAKPQPNFCWYNTSLTQKLPTNKALQNIRYNTQSGVLSFNYIHDVSTGIKAITTKTADNSIYTIDGRYVGNEVKALPKGIYIIGGKKVVISSPSI